MDIQNKLPIQKVSRFAVTLSLSPCLQLRASVRSAPPLRCATTTLSLSLCVTLAQFPSVPPPPSTLLLLQSSSASSPRVLSLWHGPFPSQPLSCTVEASTTLSILEGDGLTVVFSRIALNSRTWLLSSSSSKAESQKLLVTLWVRFLGFTLQAWLVAEIKLACHYGASK